MSARTLFSSYSQEVRNRMKERCASGDQRTALTPPQTVARLVGILEADKFESGARIDYFDEAE